VKQNLSEFPETTNLFTSAGVSVSLTYNSNADLQLTATYRSVGFGKEKKTTCVKGIYCFYSLNTQTPAVPLF